MIYLCVPDPCLTITALAADDGARTSGQVPVTHGTAWFLCILDTPNGHVGIVQLCHDLGATNVDRFMTLAAGEGHKAIVQLCHDWGATNVNGAVARDAKKGHETIVRLCPEWGAAVKGLCSGPRNNRAAVPQVGADVDTAMAYAARFGQEAIVRLCFEWDATDANWAMAQAASHVGVVVASRLRCF